MYQFTDFYALLEIGADSTEEDILAAFAKEAKEWHPNRYPGKNGRIVMQELLEARRILLNPVLKASYDKEYKAYQQSGKLPITQKPEEIEINDDWLHEIIKLPMQSKISKPRQPKPKINIFEYKQFGNTVFKMDDSIGDFNAVDTGTNQKVKKDFEAGTFAKPPLESKLLQLFIDFFESRYFKIVVWACVIGLLYYWRS